jgi:hypothetical protein
MTYDSRLQLLLGSCTLLDACPSLPVPPSLHRQAAPVGRAEESDHCGSSVNGREGCCVATQQYSCGCSLQQSVLRGHARDHAHEHDAPECIAGLPLALERD